LFNDDNGGIIFTSRIVQTSETRPRASTATLLHDSCSTPSEQDDSNKRTAMYGRKRVALVIAIPQSDTNCPHSASDGHASQFSVRASEIT
jgi:hypothetical protein